MCKEEGLTDWRQYRYNFRCVKQLMRKVQNKKRGVARSDEKKHQKAEEIKEAHRDYISSAQSIVEKVKATLLKVKDETLTILGKKLEIEKYVKHAERQIDQIERRVILEEEIPHEEKVFSIFEPHTEWVVKGKAGVPVELGLRVGVVEDHHQFILYHQVMEKQTDEKVAVDITRETKKRFPNLFQMSYDKGFHSPANQEDLKKEVTHVILPRKGKLSQVTQALEGTEDFTKARRQHSGVESVINALEVHGLDFCPDRGIKGFKTYVALAIVGYNAGRLGSILHAKEQKLFTKNRQKFYGHAPPMKIAA